MKIQTVRITNFRSIKDDVFYLYPYMVFVGKNNSGKSNIMKALDVFFGRKPEIEDFRLEGTKRLPQSTITVIFNQLLPEELLLYEGKTRFPNTPKEQLELRIILQMAEKIDFNYEYAIDQLILTTPAAKHRYGFLLNPSLTKKSDYKKDHSVPAEFNSLIEVLEEDRRKIGDNRRLTLNDFSELKQNYIQLHPELQTLPHQKIFKEISLPKSNLKKYLGNYFFIPAVQDINEETTYKGKGKSNINQLMNYILDQMREKEKEEERNTRIEKILREIYQLDNKASKLNLLANTLNQTLNQFDDSTIRFDTELPPINKLVRDSLKVYMNDGVDTAVGDKGHGLQRYFMIALFKLWAETLIQQVLPPRDMTISPTAMKTKPKKITAHCISSFFAIEEPELFLHPQYQLLMRDYLLKIAFTDDHQILLNTHSPHFIDFNDYKAVIKVMKLKKGGYNCTETLQPVIEKEGKLQLKDIILSYGKNAEKFHKINQLNLCYFMNPNRSQLFFADTVVLVEGETEKIMFQKWAQFFFPHEITKLATTTYVDCEGKFNMELYQAMLNGFHIPYVIIVDDDQGSEDPHMNSLNYHIQQMAQQANGHFITLNVDFENEFQITGHEISNGGQKKNKPYHAYQKYFDADQNPKVEELEHLRTHPKLQQIFFSIYQLSIQQS